MREAVDGRHLGPHLRECLICGHVGCCDSKNQHASRHFHESGHPIVRSFESPAKSGAGATWTSC